MIRVKGLELDQGKLPDDSEIAAALNELAQILAAAFQGFLLRVDESGVQILCGCCGLTAEHIQAARRARDTAANQATVV